MNADLIPARKVTRERTDISSQGPRLDFLILLQSETIQDRFCAISEVSGFTPPLQYPASFLILAIPQLFLVF